MFPAERGEMGEEAVWNLFDLAQVAIARSRYLVFQRMIAVTTRFSPEARCC